jgi:hypothetical protein
MAAATGDRDGQRQPSEIVAYLGASGRVYYQDTMQMITPAGLLIPAAVGAGASMARFIGVARNNVTMNNTDPGVSAALIEVWKTGEFTFAATGTGASADIGKVAWIHDDQTVGTSAAVPALRAGEIVGLPSTSAYRVRIDGAVGSDYYSGTSVTGLVPQN